MPRNTVSARRRRRFGGASPVLVVLLAILVAGVAVFILVRSKGNPGTDLQMDLDTQVLLGQSLADADAYFAKYGGGTPTKLPPDPNAPVGAEPTADFYLYQVEVDDSPRYVKIMLNLNSNQITAMHETDANGNPL